MSNPSFRLVALPAETFTDLFELNDEELTARGARRMRADAKPGYPCRVSLADAEPGEEVILVHHLHHDVRSPYRAAGPIFVCAGAETAAPGVGEIPPDAPRQTAVDPRLRRPSDDDGRRGCRGRWREADDRAALRAHDIEYLHLHNAGPGCYNCRVERA